MRKMAGVALLCLAAAGCATGGGKGGVAQAPVDDNGWLRYAQARQKGTITCGDKPVLLAADRTVLRLIGACSRVKVAGNHNDINTDVAPGGTIEITGTHNDVTWHQVGAGPKPELKNLGVSNDFHHPADG